jgi:Cd2+/Zn2+-exporting ATPase
MGGAGNAQVLETADVVLMQDDLSRLPFALDLSHRVKGLIQQNIAVSLGVKFSVAVLALLGLTPLWVAVLADIGITLAVTLNGMRAMRFQQA